MVTDAALKLDYASSVIFVHPGVQTDEIYNFITPFRCGGNFNGVLLQIVCGVCQ